MTIAESKTTQISPFDADYQEARKVFVEMQKSPHTKRAYDNDIRKWEQFVGDMKGPLGSTVAVAFKTALENTYASSTAQRVWGTVASFYGWMKGQARIDYLPFQGIKSPTRSIDEPPPVPTEKEIQAFFDACAMDSRDFGWRAEVTAKLLLNGLRAQEVCDAKISNFKFDDHNEAWVLTVKGKGDKYRRVPINSEAQQAIFDFWLNRSSQSDTEWLVPNSKGEQMNTQSVYRMIAHFGKKAGIEGLHPHAFRHHYATRLVRAGVDLFTLQKLLGHASPSTTQRYVALDNQDLVKALLSDDRHIDNETHYAMPFYTNKYDESIPLPF